MAILFMSIGQATRHSQKYYEKIDMLGHHAGRLLSALKPRAIIAHDSKLSC